MKITRPLVLALVLLSCSPLFAADEPFNHGRQWTQASIPEKTHYMEGYQAGYTMGVMNATKQFMPTATEADKEKAYKTASMIFAERRLGADMLATVILTMDQLYKDPANTFIDKGIMLELALDKIRGRDINEDLVQQRKAAGTENK
ncbi:MAG: hypothetical protein ACOY32_11510 [Thermodesulfobacteriota bacterium]